VCVVGALPSVVEVLLSAAARVGSGPGLVWPLIRACTVAQLHAERDPCVTWIDLARAGVSGAGVRDIADRVYGNTPPECGQL
jgi:hypothetical protein